MLLDPGWSGQEEGAQLVLRYSRFGLSNANKIRQLARLYAVLDRCGEVVTGGHRYRRINRTPGPGRKRRWLSLPAGGAAVPALRA